MTVARPAAAQIFGSSRPERPNRALFEGGRGDVGQALILSGALGIGVDEVIDADVEPGAGFGTPTRFGSGAASVDYGLDLPRLTITAGAGSSARYVPRYFDRPVSEQRAEGSLATRLPITARTSFVGDAAASYHPVSVLSLFPGMFESGGAPSSPIDYRIEEGPVDHYLTDSGNVGITQGLSSRSTLALRYGYHHTRASDSIPGYVNRSVGAVYAHTLSRGLSLRLGYRRTDGRYEPLGGSDQRRVSNHDIDVGVDYSKTLSFSRRTTFSFSTGSAIVSNGEVTRYDVVGNAALTHEIGRSWQADLSYARQVGFSGVIAEPTFSDSASVTVGGLLTRRVRLSAGGGASLGEVGLGDSGNSYRAYRAFANVQTALTSMLALNLSYVNYYYRFDNSSFLPSSLGTRVHRQGVQFALNLSLPLFQSARRTDAPR